MSHSPESWSIDGSDLERMLAGSSVAGPCAIVDAKGEGVIPATPLIPSGFDMQRIVVCVNFMAGFETRDISLLMEDASISSDARESIFDAIQAVKGECG